jgi:hypothetical protein
VSLRKIETLLIPCELISAHREGEKGSLNFVGRRGGPFSPAPTESILERELQTELHHAAASRTDQRIAGRDVGGGAPAAESAGTI